jgi:dihydrofolate synthase/folylpolyglutamate synthase
MAFAAFADAPVEAAVVEVGLGGTWDATNVADGQVAVITPIGIDHVEYLGSDITKIAGEKAGIIKPGATAILAQQPQVAAAETVLQHAATVAATVAREGMEFGVISREMAVGGQTLALKGLRGTYGDIFLPLFGEHQAGNAACALAAVEAFAGVPVVSRADGQEIKLGPGLSNVGLDAGIVQDGFAKVDSPGRLEVLRRSPTVIADAAHNPAGMAASVQALTETFEFATLIGVLAVSEDKDVAAVLDELEPVLSEIVVSENSSPRSMPASVLAELAAEVFGEDRVRVAHRLDEAIETAVTLADEASSGDGDVPGSAGVLITGSVVTAGDARALLAPDRDPAPVPPEPGTPARHQLTLGDLS